MKNKEVNKRMLIIVGVLLLFGGTSLAYFASKALTSGTGASTSVTTASIKGATVTVDGLIAFDSEDMLPGHISVSAVKVTATGNNELIPYNLYWNGSSGISQLNFTVYKTSKEESITSICEKKKEYINGVQQLSEECTISNLDKLGTEIATGSIKKNDTKVIITKDEFITSKTTSDIWYYYIIIEYPNLEIAQNDDMGQTITGKIYAEESNAKADINIVAAYIKQEDGSYEESDDIPQSGYALNKEKSTCSNGAIPTWTSDGLLTSNLTKSGTSCYLYFDKVIDLIATGNLVNENGYRYEGKEVNNYVIFNNELWRIIGVFDTTVVDEASGTQKQEQLIKIIRDESIGNVKWGSNYVNDWSASSLKALLNEGDYYTRSGDYSSNGLTDEAKKMIENVVWNLGGRADASATADTFYSAERGSTGANGTTDITKIKWTGKVGLMYPSDYGYAAPASTCERTTALYGYYGSGCYDNNWLFKDSYEQWTLTPCSSNTSSAFYVISNGRLAGNLVLYGYGVSPSLYLKSSVQIVDGQGTSLHPYVLGQT